MKILRQDNQSKFQDGEHQTMKQEYHPLNCRLLFRPVNFLIISNTHECRSKKIIIKDMVNDSFSLVMRAYQVTVPRHNTFMDV